MIKSSRAIGFVLIPLGMIVLGFVANSCEDDGYSTTQSSSGTHHSYWGRSSRGSSSSWGSSSHSGTSRGGFGSTGHSSS